MSKEKKNNKRAYLIDEVDASDSAEIYLKELGYSVQLFSSTSSFLKSIDGEFVIERESSKSGQLDCMTITNNFATLTNREKQVVEHLVSGDGESSNKAIAKIMNISHRTVEEHRAAAMRKLDAKSLKEVITMAINCKLFESSKD